MQQFFLQGGKAPIKKSVPETTRENQSLQSLKIENFHTGFMTKTGYTHLVKIPMKYVNFLGSECVV